MLSVTETLKIERGFKKLETDLNLALHKSHDADGMLFSDGLSTVYYAVLDWMDENVERIEFKTPKED